MIDRILSRTGVGFALLFMILELTYINAKSLNYMVQGLSQSDGVFSIIGAIAFSMVTILIMRLSNRTWLKIMFPFLDTALVLCGFNLPYADDLFGNPVRFALSVFFAVFTGLITYSLGQINAEMHDGSKDNDSAAKQIESNRIIEDQKRIIEDLQSKQIESNRIVDDSKRIANESKELANEFLANHILFLNWTNSKKKAENCNGHEAKIKGMAEQIKSGKQISVDDYLKVVK